MKDMIKKRRFARMSRAEQAHYLFDKYAVHAHSVADFLARYYRRDRYTGRGTEYAAGLLSSYEREFKELGICWISHYDNATGDVVSFVGKTKRQKPRDASLAISVPVGRRRTFSLSRRKQRGRSPHRTKQYRLNRVNWSS